MKKFNGYDDAKKAAESIGRLPVGAYICKIMNVKFVEGENGNSDRIDVMFDIAEGDYKDFFKKQYDANTSEDKKWKGKKSVYVPKDDGSEKDGWTKNTFAKWTTNLEKSNPGYSWDWDENKWKNKSIGIVFGETGTVFEGKQITFTEPRFPVCIDDVRAGSAPVAKFVAKNGYVENNGSTDTSFINVPDGSEEEIPF